MVHALATLAFVLVAFCAGGLVAAMLVERGDAVLAALGLDTGFAAGRQPARRVRVRVMRATPTVPLAQRRYAA